MGYSRNVKTNDDAKSDALKTRYYKNQFNKISEALQTFAHKEHFEVASVNTDYKELLLKKGSIAVTCSVIQVSPTTMAVDFVVIRKPVDFMRIPLPDFNVCETLISNIYKHLDKELYATKFSMN
jgi:hypothetical protein